MSPGILPGCPGRLGVFKKFAQKKFVLKKFVRILRSFKKDSTENTEGLLQQKIKGGFARGVCKNR